jgi:hypothetical protein
MEEMGVLKLSTAFLANDLKPNNSILFNIELFYHPVVKFAIVFLKNHIFNGKFY